MAETTLTQFRTEVAAVIGVDNSVAGDQGLIDRWINEGYEDFVRKTRCFADWDDMDLTADTHTYTLPTQPLAILEIYNTANGTQYRMERQTLDDIIEMRRAVSAAPARHYATIGMNLLTVYPTPGEGEAVTIYWIPRPTALTSGSDTPTSVPPEFHQAIAYYAIARAAEYDNHEPSQYGSYYRALYEMQVRECRSSIRNIGGRRNAPLVAGRPASSRISNDRSQIFHSW